MLLLLLLLLRQASATIAHVFAAPIRFSNANVASRSYEPHRFCDA
jgi:hypothetical protein